MRRRLFNLAAAGSLVLCVATAALWIISIFATIWRTRNADARIYIGFDKAAGEPEPGGRL